MTIGIANVKIIKKQQYPGEINNAMTQLNHIKKFYKSLNKTNLSMIMLI